MRSASAQRRCWKSRLAGASPIGLILKTDRELFFGSAIDREVCCGNTVITPKGSVTLSVDILQAQGIIPEAASNSVALRSVTSSTVRSAAVADQRPPKRPNAAVDVQPVAGPSKRPRNTNGQYAPALVWSAAHHSLHTFSEDSGAHVKAEQDASDVLEDPLALQVRRHVETFIGPALTHAPGPARLATGWRRGCQGQDCEGLGTSAAGQAGAECHSGPV